jgi:hypothetical protein
LFLAAVGDRGLFEGIIGSGIGTNKQWKDIDS